MADKLSINRWTVTVEKDPDDPDNLVLPLPDTLLDKMGWKPGDDLVWKDNKDGTYTLSKKE